MDRRTALITGLCVAGVVVTGATAVGANLGILHSAEQSEIGDLNAVADLVTSTPQVVDVYLDDSAYLDDSGNPIAGATATSISTAAAPVYRVDAAGLLGVDTVDGTLRLASVTPEPGWSWTTEVAQPSELVVAFSSADRRLEFHAELDANGAVTAWLDEPTTITTPAAPAATTPAPVESAAPAPTSTAYHDDDDDHDEDHDDDDDEHEGSDDDD